MLYVRAGNSNRNYYDDPEELKEMREDMIDEFNEMCKESED